MKLDIRVDGHRKVARDLQNSGTVIYRKADTFLKNQSIDVERTAKDEAPVDLAQLQGSIRIDKNYGKLGYIVEPHTKYAYFAHEGRRPGRMPPVDAVEGWAKRKGMNPFILARAIGRKGTKGKKFMDIAYKKQKPVFNREATLLLNDIVRSI